MPRQITAYSNPLVKSVRDLRDKRHRREQRGRWAYYRGVPNALDAASRVLRA